MSMIEDGVTNYCEISFERKTKNINLKKLLDTQREFVDLLTDHGELWRTRWSFWSWGNVTKRVERGDGEKAKWCDLQLNTPELDDIDHVSIVMAGDPRDEEAKLNTVEITVYRDSKNDEIKYVLSFGVDMEMSRAESGEDRWGYKKCLELEGLCDQLKPILSEISG